MSKEQPAKRVVQRDVNAPGPPDKRKKEFPGNGRFWPFITRESILSDVSRQDKQKAEGKAPSHVKNFSVSGPTTTAVNARNFNRIIVRFDIPPEQNIDKVRIMVKGYGTANELSTGGSRVAETLPWRVIAEVEKAPFDFDLELSAEEILVAALSVNDQGVTAPLLTVPTESLTLN